MRYSMAARQSAWSGGAAVMLALVALQSVVAVTTLRHPLPLGSGEMTLAVLVGIGSIILLGYCRMPAPVKRIAIAVSCAALFTFCTTQDVLGLNAVAAQSQTAVTAAAADGPAGPRRSRVTVSGGEPVAGAAQAAVAERLAGGNADVEVRLTGAPGGAQPGLSLRWSLARGSETLFCGQYSADADTSLAFAMLADRVDAAARASRGEALNCA